MESENKLYNRARRNAFRDDLRYLRTRQGAFEASMLHLDHPLARDGRILEPSDGGKGAEDIVSSCEELELWQKLWLNAYAKLPPRGKRILNALKVHWGSRQAARMAGVSQPTVDHWKTFFKMHFDQCWRAYRRDFSK